MTTNVPIHTLPSGGGWEIRQEGSTTALSEHPTRDEAIAAGRRRAKADGVEHFIHNRGVRGPFGRRVRKRPVLVDRPW